MSRLVKRWRRNFFENRGNANAKGAKGAKNAREAAREERVENKAYKVISYCGY
jgi:hypothetical protein